MLLLGVDNADPVWSQFPVTGNDGFPPDTLDWVPLVQDNLDTKVNWYHYSTTFNVTQSFDYWAIVFTASGDDSLFRAVGNVNAEPIPEPTTMFLLGSGLIGLAGLKRKFKKA